jgi:hypothetical protein
MRSWKRRLLAVRRVRLRSRLGAMTTTADPDDTPPVDAPGQPPTPESPETPDDDPQPQGLLRKQRKPSGPSRAEV